MPIRETAIAILDASVEVVLLAEHASGICGEMRNLSIAFRRLTERSGGFTWRAALKKRCKTSD